MTPVPRSRDETADLAYDPGDGLDASATQPEIPGWKALLPLAFVVAALLALAVVPVLMDRWIEQRRGEIETYVQPALALANAMEAALAHEVSLTRGFLLTGDRRFVERYLSTSQEHRTLYDEFDPYARRLGPAVMEAFVELRTLTDQRHAATEEFLAGDVTPEEFAADIPARQEVFEDALGAVQRLRAAVLAAEQDRRDSMATLRSVHLWITAGLVLLALGATLVVVRMGRRLRRRTAEEVLLRTTARRLTAALTADEIFQHAVEDGLRLTYADGAYLEQLHHGKGLAEIVAASGLAPEVSTTLPYPGSLSRDALETGEPVTLREIGDGGHAVVPGVGERCPGCSALLVPLAADDRTVATLVLLRRPRRADFSRADVGRACALGEMASLAVRRIWLLEEAEEHRREMAQLVETRSRLIRGIGHDVKNPLGAADGYAELLAEGIKGELTSEQKDFLNRIRRMHRSILDMINNLVEFARAESGELAIEHIETDVGAVIRDTAENYRGMAELAGLDLEVDVSRELPAVQTDPARVREIFGNLLSNAIKYTPSGGEVKVRAGIRSGGNAPGSGTWLTVDVEDTGSGIPPEQQDKVFEEYRRLDPESTEGAGIGLAISRKVAHLLGGDITLRSEVGEGTTFTLWLPDER